MWGFRKKLTVEKAKQNVFNAYDTLLKTVESEVIGKGTPVKITKGPWTGKNGVVEDITVSISPEHNLEIYCVVRPAKTREKQWFMYGPDSGIEKIFKGK